MQNPPADLPCRTAKQLSCAGAPTEPGAEPSAGGRIRTVLLVDDDAATRRSFRRAFRHTSLRFVEAGTADEALSAFDESQPDLTVLDARLGPEKADRSGIDHVLPRMIARNPEAKVVVFSGLKVGRHSVAAIRRGALDYFTKAHAPDEELLAQLFAALIAGRPLCPPRTTPRSGPSDPQVGELRGSSAQMEHVRRAILRVARTTCALLVTGETGTGKDVVARAVHRLSGRTGPFIRVNWAAIAKELAESELFGHEAGSFTGALSQRKGAFELARGGTLFLDEIAEMPLPQQAKILTALESEYCRVGGHQPIRFTGRLVSATNHDLARDVEAGTFRRDLYYRLVSAEIALPPLRARRGDIAEIAGAHLVRVAAGLPISMRALTELERRDWPGNVRQLQQVLLAAAARDEDGVLDSDDLPGVLERTSAEDGVGKAIVELEATGSKLLHAERAAARTAVALANGNVSAAARLLGIDRKKLSRILAGMTSET